MSKITMIGDLVSVEWLHNHLKDENIVVLDASIPKVTAARDSVSELQIPNARFFDIKNKFSTTEAPFPNTFPSQEQFQKEVRALGINRDSIIVVYDDKGIYSSARAWWLFKSFGHENVTVLDGGLPEWTNKGYPTEQKHTKEVQSGNFIAKLQQNRITYINELEHFSEDKTFQIIDARSKARFNCEVPEPRAGLRSGTIPQSKNMPFQELLENGKLKSESQLKAVFNELTTSEQTLIFSCGSGITACILALGATLSGYKKISVYDGSWTEYGSLMK